MITALILAAGMAAGMDCSKYERSPVVKLDCEMFNMKHELYNEMYRLDNENREYILELRKIVYGYSFVTLGDDTALVDDNFPAATRVRGLIERLGSLERLPRYRLDSVWSIDGYCPGSCVGKTCTTAYCPSYLMRVDTVRLEPR